MALRGSTLLFVAILIIAAKPAIASERLPAASPPGILTGYSITTWGQKDGLPSAVIWAAVQDLEGYLWLGTNTGLVRFDGVRFTEWQSLGETPLLEIPIRALTVSRDGTLWVGYAEPGGVSRIVGGQVTHYGPAQGLPEGLVSMLFEDPSGNIWAGTREGLATIRGSRWEHRGPGLPDGPAHSAHVDTDGNLLVGTADGVFRYTPGQQEFHRVDTIGGAVRSIVADSSGRIWVADPFSGLRPLDERPSGRAIEDGRGNRLLHDRRGNLWVGTRGQGLWRVRPDTQLLEKSTALTGLSNDGIESLLEDREGNIWVTTSDGLNRLTPHKVAQLVNLGLVSGVQATPDGRAWIGTVDTLIEFAGGKPGAPLEPKRLDGSPLSAMYADPRGVVWVATPGGLSRFGRRGRRQLIALGGALEASRVAAIASDGRGGVWLSDLGHRVVRWNHGRTEALTLPADLQTPRITSLQNDRKGQLWLSFADGRIAILSASGQLQTYGPQHGLQAGIYRTLFDDGTGTVWLGGTDGLSRFVDGRFETLSRTSGFPTGALIAILEDDARRFWIALEGVGVVRIARSELADAFARPSHRVRYRIYDRSDGMAGTPQWFGASSAARAKDGRLWFVSGRGATVIDPGSLDDPPKATGPVRIEGVIVNGQRISHGSATVLPPSTTRLEIAYTVLNLTSPIRTQFRYRLEGFDAGWVSAGSRRQAFYTNLPPGRYRFQVVAGDQEDGWDDSPGTVWGFTITPAFYQTTWFYATIVAMAALVIAGAWRFRLGQVRKEFSLVLGERARLSREIHDTLLQSMVGITLRFDAMANGLPPAESGTRDQLIRIRKDVEADIREARQSIWNLRSPKLAKFDLATALREAGEHAVDGHSMRFEFVVTGAPRRSNSRIEEQLLRIGQESVLNAIRHSGGRIVTMELGYEAGSIVLLVSDDGCGFDYDEARSRAADHYGMTTMQERAAGVGGVCRIVSAPGTGTRVEVVIPTPTIE